MGESILKIYLFTFFSDITNETLLCRGLLERKKTFLFNSMLIYFLLFNRWSSLFSFINRFCPVCEYVVCNNLERRKRRRRIITCKHSQINFCYKCYQSISFIFSISFASYYDFPVFQPWWMLTRIKFLYSIRSLFIIIEML